MSSLVAYYSRTDITKKLAEEIAGRLNADIEEITSTDNLIALLSVNLGVLNLLPLPVLDGGYLLILIIEGITRRKLQGRGMEIAIMIGWLFILGLFVLTMWNDLARVFG